MLAANGLGLPVVAPLALGWRLLRRTAWPSTLVPLVAALRERAPDEVAFAASKVDAGVRPDERLVEMLVVVERLATDFSVIAWQQGTLGEAAVLAGAAGYETGIGWREHCDLQSTMRSLRHEPADGGRARPVYVPSLRRGIDKRILRAALDSPRLQAGVVCLDVTCCPDGPQSLLADARRHAINARIGSLTRLVGPAHPAWRWAPLAVDAEAGLSLARRINNHIRMSGNDIPAVPAAALQVTAVVADERRASRRRHPAA